MMVWAMRLGSVVGFLSGSAVVAVNSLPVPDDRVAVRLSQSTPCLYLMI